MKLTVKNISKPSISEVTLSKSNFLASGGEGEVYAKRSKAYKVYHDPSKMIPLGKLTELAEIKNENVIRPQEYLVSGSKPVGYTMRYVKDTIALCQTFTKAFRNRNGLSHDTMQDLIKKLQSLIQDIHAANILIVDLNEMNFLVSNDFSEVFAIDTDSYQTKSYPATAIMDSIRDRHCNNKFSKETDWFSYGILSFQMFTGIHPYKGKHPDYKTLDERMLKNISVLSKGVRIPKACYGFDVIPDSYMQWYKAIFEDGKRLVPPDSFDNVQLVINIDVISGSDNLIIDLIEEYEGTIIDVIPLYGMKVLTNKHFYKTKHLNIRTEKSKAFVSASGVSLLAKINNENLELFNVDTEKKVPCSISCQSMMTHNGQLYVKSNSNVLRIETIDIKDKIMISSKVAASVLENASKFFDGVLIQNILGAFYVSIFDEKSHYQIHMPEIKGHRVTDAKYMSGVLMIVTADKNGVYDRWVFRFDSKFKTYDVRKQEKITPVGLNFTVLDNGVAVCINEDDDIEIFSNKKDSNSLKILKDKSISSDTRLYSSGAKLLFSKENKLYSAKMKGS